MTRGRGSGGHTFECHGAVVAVRPDDPTVLELVRPHLPPAMPGRAGAADTADVTYVWTRVGGAAEGALHIVAVHTAHDAPPAVLVRTADARAAAAALARDAEFRVALHARGRVFVHAAAVAWRGRVIVIPGRSHSGKTTLAAALVRAGATYLSDEYAVLGEDGLVHPFPRRLRLRNEDGQAGGTTSAEELGGTTETRPGPVGLVVWTRYRPGALWCPHPMPAGQTALAVLDNTPTARIHPAYALRVTARALVGAQGLRGARGDAEHTARHILHSLADRHADGTPLG